MTVEATKKRKKVEEGDQIELVRADTTDKDPKQDTSPSKGGATFDSDDVGIGMESEELIPFGSTNAADNGEGDTTTGAPEKTTTEVTSVPQGGTAATTKTTEESQNAESADVLSDGKKDPTKQTKNPVEEEPPVNNNELKDPETSADMKPEETEANADAQIQNTETNDEVEADAQPLETGMNADGGDVDLPETIVEISYRHVV